MGTTWGTRVVLLTDMEFSAVYAAYFFVSYARSEVNYKMKADGNSR
jgi:hypothetical protein